MQHVHLCYLARIPPTTSISTSTRTTSTLTTISISISISIPTTTSAATTTGTALMLHVMDEGKNPCCSLFYQVEMIAHSNPVGKRASKAITGACWNDGLLVCTVTS